MTEPVAFGLQLPVQSQSTIYVQDWEPSAGAAEMVQVAAAVVELLATWAEHLFAGRPFEWSSSLEDWRSCMAEKQRAAKPDLGEHVLAVIAEMSPGPDPLSHPLRRIDLMAAAPSSSRQERVSEEAQATAVRVMGQMNVLAWQLVEMMVGVLEADAWDGGGGLRSPEHWLCSAPGCRRPGPADSRRSRAGSTSSHDASPCSGRAV